MKVIEYTFIAAKGTYYHPPISSLVLHGQAGGHDY